MTPIVPRVAIFNTKSDFKVFGTTEPQNWFAKGFEVHFFDSDISSNILVNNRFNVLVFVGNTSRWINSQKNSIPKLRVETLEQLTGDMIYDSYFKQSINDINPLISIFTPAFNSFERFSRLYRTLKDQSYDNWELIVIDDSPNDENFYHMSLTVENDHRVKIFYKNRRDGLVGSVKRQAASLCSGEYIMEVDHDDELHHLALEYCVAAFKKFPDAGFCYSNAAEIYETGGVVNYGENYALGQGLHFEKYYKGRRLLGSDTPINSNTIRHIVGAPNHFRCWKRSVYEQVNKHNSKFAIVDDYELVVRTFLATKFIHIPDILYIQYMNAGQNNTQEPRRKEIQRLVDHVQRHYDRQIHERIIELGGEDWTWNEEHQRSFIHIQPPKHLNRSTLAYVFTI